MMHKRRWCLGTVSDEQTLARMLSGQTWTLCSAFYLEGRPDYLFVNDATCEDGAGEYGIVKRLSDGQLLQVESITFSWCDESRALDFIRRILSGEFDGADYAKAVSTRLESPTEHGRCHLCARQILATPMNQAHCRAQRAFQRANGIPSQAVTGRSFRSRRA